MMTLCKVLASAYLNENDIRIAVAKVQEMPEYGPFLKEWRHKVSQYAPGEPNFSCPDVQTTSDQIPTSVHSVRPGDIKVVAALGDSLSAANGALATNVVEVINEYRGQSFTGGGDDTLKQTVTLPNVLRTFNKDFYGYGLGIGKQQEYGASHLNVAVPGSTAEDLPPQAQELVKRLKSDPNVNFEQLWKLISIFIGGNDVCAVCRDSSRYGPPSYQLHLDITLKTLFSNIPRAIVQFVGMIHVELLRTVGVQKATCETMHAALCPCVADINTVPDSVFIKNEIGYVKATNDFMANGKYERNDFTVINQPFGQNTLQGPLNPDGTVDVSFFAPDCFHFHQKGHNTVARFLWNNMLQPVGQKLNNANLTSFEEPLQCPDKTCPFIRTTANSKNCAMFF